MESTKLPVLRHRHMSLRREYHIDVTASRPTFIPLNHVKRPDAQENVLESDVDTSTVLEQYTSTVSPPTLIEFSLE